jgi:hypothetical protein
MPPEYRVRLEDHNVKIIHALDNLSNIVIDKMFPRRFTPRGYGLEVNDGEASLAEADTVLGIVASGFFLP